MLVKRVAIAICAALLIFSNPVAAHSAFGLLGSGASVWGGPIHFFTSPLSVALIFGLALVIFEIKEPWLMVAALCAGALAALSVAVTAWLPAFVAPAAAVIVGLCAVLAWKPSTFFSLSLAVLAGLGAGAAADLEKPRSADFIGIALTVIITTAWLGSALDDLAQRPRLRTVMPIATRVLGSWVTAIGLLLGALAVLVHRS